MSKPTAALFCPGRGSYGRDELGFIAKHRRPGPVDDALRAADADRGDDTIAALDGAERFRPGLHLQGVHSAELIYFSTMCHLEHLRDRYEIVVVGGNSLGWYTALAASGALDPGQGAHLVRSMAMLQANVAGGQMLTTLLDEDWQPDPQAQVDLRTAIDEVNAAGHFVAPSIRLGGHAVVGGSDGGIAALMKALPSRKVGDRSFPFQIAGTGPFHTSLCEGTAKIAQDRLRDLEISMPKSHLIDGVGNLHTPWSADPEELRDYTLNRQVVETFDFSATVRTAIREFNPDVLLCAGPGTSLRAPVGHVALAERYRGLQSRDALFAAGLVVVD